MRWLVWLIASEAFFLSPWLACGSDPADAFQYGDVEMRTAVVGTWDLAMALTSGDQTSVTIGLDQATTAQALSGPLPTIGHPRSLVRPAAACGQRTLLKSAAACVSITSMPLVGVFVAGATTYSTTTIYGELTVAGLQFATGQLSISLGDGTRITAPVSSGGKASPGTLWGASGEVLGAVTLSRTAP